MTPEEIAKRGILTVYTQAQRDLRALRKVFDGNVEESNIYQTISYMEETYTDIIKEFKSNGNKLLYDVK